MPSVLQLQLGSSSFTSIPSPTSSLINSTILALPLEIFSKCSPTLILSSKTYFWSKSAKSWSSRVLSDIYLFSFPGIILSQIFSGFLSAFSSSLIFSLAFSITSSVSCSLLTNSGIFLEVFQVLLTLHSLF